MSTRKKKVLNETDMSFLGRYLNQLKLFMFKRSLVWIARFRFDFYHCGNMNQSNARSLSDRLTNRERNRSARRGNVNQSNARSVSDQPITSAINQRGGGCGNQIWTSLIFYYFMSELSNETCSLQQASDSELQELSNASQLLAQSINSSAYIDLVDRIIVYKGIKVF